MKLKLFLGTLLISVVVTQALALEGKDFRIISEKIEKSPNTIGGFVPKETKSTDKTFYVSAWAQAKDAQGHTHQNILISANHSFNISNYTSQKQRYAYKYDLSCDGRYVTKTDYVEVAPGGYLTSASESYMYLLHSTLGSWVIQALTEVTGESGNSHTSNAILRVTQ